MTDSEMLTDVIEGFFVETEEGLIFDVKGITHPPKKVIAFVRYVPIRKLLDKTRANFQKLYALKDRYLFLDKNYPFYLFNDPKGRGLLQAVPLEKIKQIFNPISRLEEICSAKEKTLSKIERLTKRLATMISETSGIPLTNVGISGSILVNLDTDNSDIDLVIYGRENCSKVYQSMPSLFESKLVQRYSKSELRALWMTRGQEKQLTFDSFYQIEKRKHLQGTIGGKDFYIRCVLLPSEFSEKYTTTTIEGLGVVDIEATIGNAEGAFCTPCIYQIEEVTMHKSSSSNSIIPDRIFSVRGRYCEVAKTGERIRTRGKLEKVETDGLPIYYQIALGTVEDEFFKIVGN